MAKYINTACLAFGHCDVHDADYWGVPITYSPGTTINELPAVRVGDQVQASCGHIGTVVSGSTTVYIDNMLAATGDSSITGDYIATFVTIPTTVEE